MTEQLTNNPLLNAVEKLVAYEQIKAEHIVPALEFLLKDAKMQIEQAITLENPTWDNFIERTEYGTSRLWRAWNVVNHLNSVQNTDEIRAAYNTLLPQISEFSTWIGLNKDLFNQYKKLYDSKEFQHLNKTRQRIITEAIKDFKLGGVELEGAAKERYAEISEQMAMTSQQFALNTLDATDNWSYTTTDATEVEGIPEQALAAANALADGKGWTFNLKMPSYLPVMQYAKSPALRERMYKAYATIASEQGNPEFDNSRLIERLLALRVEESKLLGYQDFSHMQLQTRMADSAEQVIAFLRDLASRAKPFAQKDVEALKQFAKEQLNLEQLEPWDYAYVSEQLRQARYNYSDEQIKQYLPEDTVMQGFFAIVKTLFSIDLEPADIETWHKDVKVYSIKEAGETLGLLYVDLYSSMRP